jgi:quercetin dioxygenase-like cupin family protein
MKRMIRGSESEVDWRTIPEDEWNRVDRARTELGGKGIMLLKELNADPASGTRTTVVRFSPGYMEPEQEHDFWEECYCIEGELREEKKAYTLKAGSYECLPPHTKHGPYSTKVGCVLFIVEYV